MNFCQNQVKYLPDTKLIELSSGHGETLLHSETVLFLLKLPEPNLQCSQLFIKYVVKLKCPGTLSLKAFWEKLCTKEDKILEMTHFSVRRLLLYINVTKLHITCYKSMTTLYYCKN